MLTLRKAEHTDKERILEISSTIWDGDDYLPKVYDQWVADTKGEFTVAELDGTVIGCAKYTKLSDKVAWLEGIRGDKKFSGNGFSAAMTDYYISKARKENVDSIRLSTFIENYQSIHTIEKYGFKKDGYFSFGFKELDGDVNIKQPDNVINIMSTATAWHFITNSNFYMMANGYVSEGWEFLKLDYELLDDLIKAKRVFGALKEGRITAMIILTKEPTSPEGMSIGYLDGNIEGIKTLLEFAIYTASAGKREFLSVMATLDEGLIDMLDLFGFEFIAEKPREVNVFVYTYKL